MKTALALPTCAATLALLAACAGPTAMPTAGFSQDSLPDAVKVPAGHRVAMQTVGVGEITYECRARTASAPAMQPEFEWAFVGPKAVLNDRSGQAVGRYYGPPATWEASDGSKITATQLAVAPAGNGNLPLQLVKANAAMGSGAMSGVSHVQRLATRGGTAPALPCNGGNAGQKQVVTYQADYVFWKQG